MDYTFRVYIQGYRREKMIMMGTLMWAIDAVHGPIEMKQDSYIDQTMFLSILARYACKILQGI